MAKFALVARSDLKHPLANEFALLVRDVPAVTFVVKARRKRGRQTRLTVNFRKKSKTTIARRPTSVKTDLDTLLALDL